MKMIPGVLVLFCIACSSLGCAGEMEQEKEVEAISRPPLALNVRDFGARGDGKADDTDAIQQALDKACDDKGRSVDNLPPRTVVFPRGTYRITRTINLARKGKNHGNLEILGTGLTGQYKEGTASTKLIWDGAEGDDMFFFLGVMGVRMTDLYLSGSSKAGTLIRIDSLGGAASAQFSFSRLTLHQAGIGIECGRDLNACSSDMTFTDLQIRNMKTACFVAHQMQQVNFVFIRCNAGFAPVGYSFPQGGAATFLHSNFAGVDTCLKIGNEKTSAGVNNGGFSMRGLWMERGAFSDPEKRMCLIDATGGASVTVIGVQVGCQKLFRETADYKTPNFRLSRGAHISVIGSLISGRIADLTGREKNAASWIQFDNCRFHIASDPRKDIAADEFSGYEFRNAHVTTDDGTGNHRRTGNVMIPYLVKYPKQAEGQPGRDK